MTIKFLIVILKLPSVFYLFIILLTKYLFWGYKLCHIRTERIGHLFGNVDMYLSLIEKNKIRKQKLIFFRSIEICNYEAFKIVQDKIGIIHSEKYFLLYKILCILKFKFLIYELPSDQDVFGIMRIVSKQLDVSNGINEITKKYLKNFEKKEFITTIVRDQRYLQKTLMKDFQYHNFRNADPQIHYEALIDITKKYKLLCFKMGVISDHFPLKDKNIIDYSSKDRTEKLDLGLINNSLFWSNCGSGLSSVPRAFRIPMINVNQVSLNYTGDNVLVFIPKKLWVISEKRFLTYEEIITSKVGYFLSADEYIKCGIELIENTKEEIFDVHEEGYLKIKGLFLSDPEINIIQKRLINKYPTDMITPKYKAPICEAFIRKNPEIFKMKL